MTDDGKAKTVTNIPEDFFLEDFQSGETQISVLASGIIKPTSDRISDAVSRHEVIDMTVGLGKIVSRHEVIDKTARLGEISLHSKINNASSVSREGKLTLAVILVRDEHGNAPDYTALQISDEVFGTNGDPSNLVRSYYFVVA